MYDHIHLSFYSHKRHIFREKDARWFHFLGLRIFFPKLMFSSAQFTILLSLSLLSSSLFSAPTMIESSQPDGKCYSMLEKRSPRASIHPSPTALFSSYLVLSHLKQVHHNSQASPFIIHFSINIYNAGLLPLANLMIMHHLCYGH